MPIDINPSVVQQCAEIVDAEILNTRFIGGGDINTARILESNRGRYFLKLNHGPQAIRMFTAEAKGLQLLHKAGVISVPRVLGLGQNGQDAFLLLSFVEAAQVVPNSFWEVFGTKLAELHQHSAPTFGLDFDNFIGSLPQMNSRHERWCDFYIYCRLEPQVRMALDTGRLNKSHLKQFENLYKHLPDILPEEPPALIHGDLWRGNFICSVQCEPWLVDPAVCFAHREMDLAMAQLFGGFDRLFFKAYEEAYPLQPGYGERRKIYQLYYLLVHLNLFGTGYVTSIENIIGRYR